jgi:dihydrofolate synthase/folylpolyglutamate synthase
MSGGERNPSYRTAIEFLRELSWFGARLGLAATLRLAGLSANPHRALRFIHVAGTNGKGSTCAMLESIYRTAGLRVGLFTSPHLVSLRERIQVNRQMISEADVVRLVEKQRRHLEALAAEDQPTFFEVITVMALCYFAEQNCDLVIWETGLGGRLDATNIVTPIASVITNIQYDHQKWLGETLASIAVEKAGIIKPGVPVITGVDGLEALSVIRKTAADKNAPLIEVEPQVGAAVESCGLSLLGDHQCRNAAIALATVETLQKQIPLSVDAARASLAEIQWPGRLQLITQATGQKILLDGAHNVAGAEALAGSLTRLFPNERPALILGILRDKDWAGMFRALAPTASRITLVSVQNERTSNPDELAASCRSFNPAAEVTCCSSLEAALADTRCDGLIVVAGSLYLVGEAMELLELAPAAERDEQRLNEWSGSTGRQ